MKTFRRYTRKVEFWLCLSNFSLTFFKLYIGKEFQDHYESYILKEKNLQVPGILASYNNILS